MTVPPIHSAETEDGPDVFALLEDAFYLLDHAQRQRSEEEQEGASLAEQFRGLAHRKERQKALELLRRVGVPPQDAELVYEHVCGQDQRLEEISVEELKQWVHSEQQKDPNTQQVSLLGIEVLCRVGSRISYGIVMDARRHNTPGALVVMLMGAGGSVPLEEVAQVWKMVPVPPSNSRR